ncbi:DUF1542 domain-containing protein [Tomitella gaofuii]|uniref:DUF1542 domain-containing protein n=1 Tax=Tomitella gaofuii TaxID=2760083 RepID=UPI0020BED377|nr:DUF1542 domain-containing protein [Tomitella gaofuii]
MGSPVLFVALFVLVALVVAVVLARRAQRKVAARDAARHDGDAARPGPWVVRLTGQLDGPAAVTAHSPAAHACLQRAGECRSRAAGLLPRAATPALALRAQEAAVAGLHFVRAARIADGAGPGAPLPPLAGADTAGAVGATRTVSWGGREASASPTASDDTPHYFPGGRVRGRPVPAGWYSERWWSAADTPEGWSDDAAGYFDTLLAGLPGVPYDGDDFERGHGVDPGVRNPT